MSDFIQVDDLLRIIFGRLPIHTIADVQLVSRQWRRLIQSESFAREHYDKHSDAYPKALLLISNSHIFVIYIATLPLLNSIHATPCLCVREFPSIQFPVTAIIGTCQGLVCVTDVVPHLYVINPRTLSVRRIIGEAEHPRAWAWAYGFGWRLVDTLRCHLIVKVRDSRCRTLGIFNLTSGQWTEHRFDERFGNWNWTCFISEGSAGAFADGNFMWLGTVNSAAGRIPSVIVFDASQYIFRHIDLRADMQGFPLRIGNLGENVTGVWGTDDQLTCFWLLDVTSGVFTRFEILGYPSGIQYDPLCFLGPSQILMLQGHHIIDLYTLEGHKTTEQRIENESRNEVYMASVFTPSLLSTGESQVHDNVLLEGQLALGELEEHRTDARRKHKGKGKGCFKCGALNHIAKECTGASASRQKPKPQKYILNNVRQHGGRNNSRYEMVYDGDTPESSRKRRLQSHSRDRRSGERGKSHRTTESSRDKECWNRRAANGTPVEHEEHQSDARLKDKGKGCFKCGALDHLAKECTANKLKPQNNANRQHGGGNNYRYEMVYVGDTPESSRKRRLQSHSRDSQSGERGKSHRTTESSRDEERCNRRAANGTPVQHEEHQSDARLKDKGKGKGCFKCGALDHLAKECTANKLKPQNNANRQHGGGNYRYEMVYVGDTPESSRKRRLQSHSRDCQSGERGKSHRTTESSRDEDCRNRHAANGSPSDKKLSGGRSHRYNVVGRRDFEKPKLTQRDTTDTDDEHKERQNRTAHGDRTTDSSRNEKYRNEHAANDNSSNGDHRNRRPDSDREKHEKRRHRRLN